MFVLLTALVLSLLSGTMAGCNRDADHQTVTATQLTDNWTAYYGKKVALTGTFSKPWLAIPACEPTGGDDPHIIERYATYRGAPYLVDHIAFKVMATSQNGTRYETSLPAEEGQTITVRGLVEPATVVDFCNHDLIYRSLYLVADYGDITLP